MFATYNFTITADAPVSKAFLDRGIADFTSAAKFMRALPYKRNANKEDLLTVFTDGCGTCSTKHALLRQLAVENGRDDIKLMLGVLKMNADNAPKIAATLQKHSLAYMPEAHNYLMIGADRLDYTFPNSNSDDFINDLMSEIEIEPHQITSYKVAYHKEVLQQWITDTNQQKSLSEIWAIREQCIADLSN
jgi:hypothetical protein